MFKDLVNESNERKKTSCDYTHDKREDDDCKDSREGRKE